MNLFSFTCRVITAAFLVGSISLGLARAGQEKDDAALQEQEVKKQSVKKDADKEQSPKTVADDAASKKQGRQRARKQFTRRDKNADGVLTLDEFAVIPKKLTDTAKIEKRRKALGRQFKRRDKDQDGKLSAQEFASQPPKRANRRKRTAAQREDAKPKQANKAPADQ